MGSKTGRHAELSENRFKLRRLGIFLSPGAELTLSGAARTARDEKVKKFSSVGDWVYSVRHPRSGSYKMTGPVPSAISQFTRLRSETPCAVASFSLFFSVPQR